MAVELGMSVGGTLEYNSDTTKRGKQGRPTNASLAESRSFRYDANALLHMYNNLHVVGRDSPWYHEVSHPWSPGIKKKWPVVEMIIGKNKISDNKESHYFDFHCGSSYFDYVDPAVAIGRAVKNESLLEGKLDDDDTKGFSLDRFQELE
jgi:hypothetical protein